MRSVTVRLEDLKTMVLCIGYVGENEHTRVTFDAMKMYAQYPHASVSLTVQPPEGDAYPAVIERDGDLVIWEVTDSDLIHEGSGELQLSFTDGEKVAKTYIGRFRVHRSIVPTGEIPEPLDDFLTRAGAALTAIPETIDEEFEAITADAVTLEPGSSATAEFDPETKILTIGVPEGQKGDPGQDGADGLDGYTPQRGVDYWTPADQAAMLQDIATEKADAIAAIENKGTQQVGLVTDEGTTQKAAVQAKGAEVLESIPSDYSTLSSDVSDLKSAISVLEPAATSSDVGKFLKAKTVSGGKVTEYEFGSGGGGGGGTSDYSDLTNKPQINSVTLSGNKSLDALGIAPAGLIAPYYEDLTFPVYAGTNCIHNGTLYGAINDIQTSEAWNPAHWASKMSLTENIGSLWASLDDRLMVNSAAPDYADLEFPVTEGTYCSYLGFIYIANQDIQTFGEFDYDAWDSVTVMDEVAKKYEKPSGGIPASDIASGVIPSVPVQDVQVNGTSVLSQGVASITIDPVVTVSGTTPTITAVSGTRYICGECSTLTITAPESGCIDVTFVSGSTPTVLTVSSAKSGVSAIKWANGFDPTSLEANTTYEINILDGEFGVVGSWT